MILNICGSSSLGNTYILESKGQYLILESGVSFKEVLRAIDFDISKVVGVCVSHSHL